MMKYKSYHQARKKLKMIVINPKNRRVVMKKKNRRVVMKKKNRRKRRLKYHLPKMSCRMLYH
jgi:hypothetical protein